MTTTQRNAGWQALARALAPAVATVLAALALIPAGTASEAQAAPKCSFGTSRQWTRVVSRESSTIAVNAGRGCASAKSWTFYLDLPRSNRPRVKTTAPSGRLVITPSALRSGGAAPGGTYRVMAQAKLRTGGTVTQRLGWVHLKMGAGAIVFTAAHSETSVRISGAAHALGWNTGYGLTGAKLRVKSQSNNKTYTVTVGKQGRFSALLKGLKPGRQHLSVSWKGTSKISGFRVNTSLTTMMTAKA